MRSVAVVVCLILGIAFVLSGSATAAKKEEEEGPDPAATEFKYYLHAKGCQGGPKLSMNFENSKADDPCNHISGPGGNVLTYPADDELNRTLPAGAKVSFEVYLLTVYNPDRFVTTLRLEVGDDGGCEATSPEETYVPLQPVKLSLSCTIDEVPKKTEKSNPTVVIEAKNNVAVQVGYEGDRASWVKFDVLPAQAAANKTTNKTAIPVTEAPGVWAPVAAAGLLGAALLARRRDE